MRKEATLMQKSMDKVYFGGMEIEIDQKMHSYLRENHPEYSKLCKKCYELSKEYPVISHVLENDGEIYIDGMDHQKVKEYLQLRDAMESIERQYYFYYGQSTALSFQWFIEKLKNEMCEKHDHISEIKDEMLTLLMEGRVDMAEQEYISSSKEYRDCIEEETRYAKAVSELELPKEVKEILDEYIAALLGKYILRSDYMYRCGMKDAMILFNMIE